MNEQSRDKILSGKRDRKRLEIKTTMGEANTVSSACSGRLGMAKEMSLILKILQ